MHFARWGFNGTSSATMIPQNEVQQARRTVALQLEHLDEQLQSPLYDGKIPPDIRKIIFDYAMAEYVDSSQLYETNTDYTRPNYLGKKEVPINLLLVCKRSYLETRHLPLLNKTFTFWHGRGPIGHSLRHNEDQLRCLRRFQPAQLALVKEIHFFTQQWWLESSLSHMCASEVLQGMEKVKITLRRGDWWWNERNAPLAITPQRQGADYAAMTEDWRKEKCGQVVEWDPKSWGSAFRHLKCLKELEMEFETYEYKHTELDEILRHAVLWKFPMGDGKVLSADGLNGIKTSSWRGPPCGWSQCPKCAGRNQTECKFCEEMEGLKREGKGPMLIIRSLRWKLAQAN